MSQNGYLTNAQGAEIPGGGVGVPSAPDDPTSHGKPPWYRRRAVLIGGAIAIIAAITVVSDLPQNSSTAQKIADQKAVLRAINTDVHPCTFSVSETFSLYRRELAGGLTASERAQIPDLMRDDQAACSFTNATIFNLSTITVPGTSAGHEMGAAVTTVTIWATSDALAAIEDIQALSSNPHDAKALSDLKKQEKLLASDQAKADAEVAAAGRDAGGHIPAPSLPRLPDVTTKGTS